MKAALEKFANRIDVLTLRERVIVFVMVALLLIVCANIFILSPLDQERKEIGLKNAEQQAQIVRIHAEIQQKSNERTADPDLSNARRAAELEQQVERLRASVAQVQKGLISPARMTKVLEEILRKSKQLQLVSVKKLAPEGMVESSAEGGKNATAQGLYRHGVIMVVRGSYLDMLQYLQELEKLQTPLLWGDVLFEVGTHPGATMTLTVFTLSLDKQWLHI